MIRHSKKITTGFEQRAQMTTREAYLNALASGESVLIKEDNNIIQVNPDGSEKILKTTPRLKSRFKDQVIYLR